MAVWTSSENWDSASVQDSRIAGITEGISDYPRIYRSRTCFSTESDLGRNSLFSSRLKKPRLMRRLSRHQIITSSAVASLDYPERIPVKQQFEISRDADDFISRQKKSFRYRQDIFSVSERAVDFLRKQGIDAQVSVSLFTDPEYEDWIEPKIAIEVPRTEIKRAYELYSNLLSHSLKGVHKSSIRKIFVTLESR